MARADRLLVESIGEETVVYDLDSKEAHCLKSLAAVVFAHADGRNTAADIAELAAYRLGRPVTEAEAADAVAQLEQCGLLNTQLVIRDGLSRRDALRRIAVTGVGATVGASLITTIVAPTALASASQIPTGDCCGDTTLGDNCTGGNPHCVSGHCCQNTGGKSCNQCKCVGDKNDCEIGAVGCSLANPCPAGNQCVTLSDGTTTCCTVIVAPGGGTVNC